MLGHGEMGSQQQSYCCVLVYTSSMPCSYNKTECVQNTLFFTCNNFVNKGATQDELDKNATNVYFP
jgi:hypothetical protein